MPALSQLAGVGLVSHNVYVNGFVHVRAKRCSTCIFGNRSPVSVERREEMVERCGEEGVIPCHHHLGEDVEPVCRGFYETGNNVLLRLATALDLIDWTVDG